MTFPDDAHDHPVRPPKISEGLILGDEQLKAVLQRSEVRLRMMLTGKAPV